MSERESTPLTRAEIASPKVKSILSKLETLYSQQQILNLRVSGLRKRIEDHKRELTAICKHENVNETNRYYGGSYDEQARTFYTHTCVICGTVLKEWNRSHGYYG